MSINQSELAQLSHKIEQVIGANPPSIFLPLISYLPKQHLSDKLEESLNEEKLNNILFAKLYY